jgi:hypothetical protein
MYVTNVIIGKMYTNHGKTKVLIQENHDKPLSEMYKYPICHTVQPKGET